MRILYYICLFYIYHPMISIEYIYPITSYQNGNFILYIYQTSPEHIQLFQWNSITNHSEQLLCSLFKPAAVQLLPNNKGFSFLDNGRLRIKLFQKRSPKTIDFDEPLFNINGLHWVDEHVCYCSAQYNNYISLFELYDDGRVKRLLAENDQDCLYPQKINNQLFYISRDIRCNLGEPQYKIIQSLYGENITDSEVIYDFYNKPIIFLNMISETKGFVIEYEKNKDNELLFNFYYHSLVKENNQWKDKYLFSFVIPSYLFLDDNHQRLFESVLPLLPRIIQNKIYFTDYSYEIDKVQLYYYDLLTNKKNKVSIPCGKNHIFAPIICNDILYYGRSAEDGRNDLFSCFLT